MSLLIEFLRRIWDTPPANPSRNSPSQNPLFPNLNEELAKFISAPWEPRDPPLKFFCIVGEMHVERFKEDALAKKARQVWKDVRERIELACQLMGRRPLTDDEKKILKFQLIPLTKLPIPYARECGFPREIIPEPQNLFGKLCRIMSGDDSFPEADREQLNLELFLLRSAAVTSLTLEKGDLLDYNWVDILRCYKNEGPEQAQEAERVLQHLRLIGTAYDRIFKQPTLKREGGAAAMLPIKVSGFPGYLNTLRLEGFSRFTLKFPPHALGLLGKYLLEPFDEEEPNSVLYFFRHVEAQMGKHCNPDHELLWGPLVQALENYFNPQSRLGHFLGAALLFTMTLQVLEKRNYPPLEEGWQDPFFEMCRLTEWKDRKELFKKLLSLDPCAAGPQKSWKAETFLILYEKKWLSTYHLVWVFFHELELVHTAKRDLTKMASVEVIGLVEEIQRFLGVSLSSEYIWAIFGGTPLSHKATTAISNLKIFRRDIKEEQREFFQHFIKADLERRHSELKAAFGDDSPLKVLKENLVDMLWCSTYLPPLYTEEFKHIPCSYEREDLDTGIKTERRLFDLIYGLDELTIYPQGVWFKATTQFGLGPHLRADWKTQSSAQHGVFRFEIIYSPSLWQHATISKIFFLEIPDLKNSLAQPRFQNWLKASLLNYLAEGDEKNLIEATGKNYPVHKEKIGKFFKEVNISFRNMPDRIATPDSELSQQPLEAILRQRRTFPILEGKGISLLPPDHIQAADPAYSLIKEHYWGFAEMLIQKMKDNHDESVKVGFEAGDILVTIHVLEEPKFNPKLFVLTASATVEGIPYQDKIGFPHSCSELLQAEMILGLLIQFKGLIYRERFDAALKHSQSQKENLAT